MSQPAGTPIAEAYEKLRPLLFSIAYRMLGSVTEAEDIVQDAFVRYQAAVSDHGEPDSPKAYLSTIVTRLCIDHLHSARVRRESYAGEWLPEPLLTGPESLGRPAADPAAHAEQADSLSMAFLLLLERLSPLERAVFLLHDVFGYNYDETGAIVSRSPASCRQLAHRARQHVEAERPRFDVRAEQRNELAARFFEAVEDGDMAGLIRLLAADVEVHGDGAGVGISWRKPIVGREHVARLLGAVGKQLHAVQGSFRRVEVNGQPGALVLASDGSLIAVLTLDIADGEVQTFRSVLARDKLRHLGPLADIGALIEQRRGGASDGSETSGG
ncbi:MAG TPA: RNA polymerase sigma-70 factor [Streptosporangiaceae bacterium]